MQAYQNNTGYSDPYGNGYGYGTGTSYGADAGTGYGTGYGYGYGTGYGVGYGNSDQLPSIVPTPRPVSTPIAAPSSPAIPNISQPTANPLLGNPESPMKPYRDAFFKNYGSNPFIEADIDKLSTFALDVDTGSYTFARGQLASGKLPPKDSVRTEEYLNSFKYFYPQPASEKFAIHTELAASYFGDENAKLLRIGIQGKEVLDNRRKNAVLTYVIDVSGSMDKPERLPLVKQSLNYLLSRLQPDDMVGIVVYGTSARVALPHTKASDRASIHAAIESLRPEGSTNVEAGLNLGYEQAGKAFKQGAANRVILCSDGVANVGETGPDRIMATVKARSESGIALTTLGFGLGDYSDVMMERLADQGDGHYAYVDTLDEYQRVFGADLIGTLQLIAKDTKVQVDFNPAVVAEYRLMGYENRDIADRDFRNDQIDAGEIGANHSVTALYEIRLKPGVSQGDLATVYLRYKDIDDLQRVKELNQKVSLADLKAFSDTTPSFQLATAVAEFAEQLRGSVFADGGKLSQVQSLAMNLQGQLPDSRVRDFLNQVNTASRLQLPLSTQSGEIRPLPVANALPEWEKYLLRQLGGNAGR